MIRGISLKAFMQDGLTITRILFSGVMKLDYRPENEWARAKQLKYHD